MSTQEIFNTGANTKGQVDEEAFTFLCKKFCSPIISESQSRYVFQTVRKKIGLDLSLSDFINVFGLIAPRYNYHIEGLRYIRDWMYKSGLTSDQAYDEIANKRKSLNIEEFDTEMKKKFKMTSPEIEAIFVAIDENGDGLIDRTEWCGKIYEDTQNPLQLFREVINQNHLSSDDLLFKMNLRIWDDPLDFPKFCKALRILDSSLTDKQLKAMAKPMKNANDLVQVNMLMKNLVGQDFETVDFRDKLYKRVYHEIFVTSDSSRKEKLRDMLIENDDLCDGTIIPKNLQSILSKLCRNIRASDIEKFIRFLDKDHRGRIDYTQFTNKVEEIKNFNPFKTLVGRINSFMKQNNQNIEKFMRRLVLGEMQAITGQTEEVKFDSEKKVSVDYFARFLKNKVDKKCDLEELMNHAETMDIDKDGFISEHDLF